MTTTDPRGCATLPRVSLRDCLRGPHCRAMPPSAILQLSSPWGSGPWGGSKSHNKGYFQLLLCPLLGLSTGTQKLEWLWFLPRGAC